LDFAVSKADYSFSGFDFRGIWFRRSADDKGPIAPAEFVTEIAVTAAVSKDFQTPPLFDRSYKVDETYDEHKIAKSSKTYSFDFPAETGAKIVSARFVEESAAAASDRVITIRDDRTQANFKFRLESGPVFDQWRGWWHGQIVLTQQRDPEQQQQTQADCH
jgi:hypothetical protein